MATEKQHAGNGIGISGILTIIFTVAKLLGLITWSWIWVLSPLWISASLLLGFLIVVGLFLLIAIMVGALK